MLAAAFVQDGLTVTQLVAMFPKASVACTAIVSGPPATIYAALLDNRYTGVIHKSDLLNQNPYNTYQNAGLPPGPIANPGAASLEASLHPAATDYLFFVAKADGGGHVFSATRAAHEKAVMAYRHARHKAG